MKTGRVLTSLFAFVTAVCFAGDASAVIAYSTIGSTYTQNFDTLPNTPTNASLGTTAAAQGWINDTASPGANQYSIAGWHLFHPVVQSEGGIDGHQRLRITTDTGSTTTGSFYSFGNASSTERALGTISSTSLATAGGNNYFGMRLTNSTGATLTNFTVGYTGEQWRVAAATGVAGQKISLAYSLTATSIQNSPAFTAITGPSTDFVSLSDPSGSGGGTNGNAAGFRTTGRGGTITGINWAPGTDLWIRWITTQPASGSANGLAIDDVIFSAIAVPEASSFLFVGLAGVLIHFGRKLFGQPVA